MDKEDGKISKLRNFEEAAYGAGAGSDDDSEEVENDRKK